jgi:predicted ATPase
MKYRVTEYGLPKEEGEAVYLAHTGWDDWFEYSTMYAVDYVDASGQEFHIGMTKIGRFGLKPARRGADVPDARYPDPPREFNALTSKYFSLGQDPEFYEALSSISDSFREQVLTELRDIAYDPKLLSEAESQDVTRVSLLRAVPIATVRDQFHRLAHGGARLTPYNLGYRLSYSKANPVPTIRFEVVPESMPPTNIHVLIGRNGVGKSTFLNHLASHLVRRSSAENESKTSRPSDDSYAQITNLVSVSFSAFDAFEPLTVPRDRSQGPTYHYVGLKKKRAKADEPESIKGPKALAAEMSIATRLCFEGSRRSRWLRGLRLLEADPIFASVGISEVVASAANVDEVRDAVSKAFRNLSSGHKIVLLTITKLVETVEEKSLVLLDEPEAHLHPPLLSAFIRALSDLLVNRNGVAVVATHSPVVLQEVPRACVSVMSRAGEIVTVDRPQLETFGENVGILTNEVFGLEVAATGFHRMLWEAANDHHTYEAALGAFNGSLGTEGKAILRAMTNALRDGQHVGG